MTDRPLNTTWLSALSEAATAGQVELPAFDAFGMGALRSASTADGRFVTLKRRIGVGIKTESDAVEWALWDDRAGSAVPIAIFREPLQPAPDDVATVLLLLKGWLVDGWSQVQAAAAVGKHPLAQKVKAPPPLQLDKQEYWLSEDHGFGIVVTKGEWAVYHRGKSLCSWREKKTSKFGDSLPVASLGCLCSWLAGHWEVVAMGGDVRPTSIRENYVAASLAYALIHETAKGDDVSAWWSRHSVRASGEELPNLFLERQGEEVIFSWDSAPTATRDYPIPLGAESTRVPIVVPTLRRLVRDHLALKDGPAREEVKTILSSSPSAGYAAISGYNPAATAGWLSGHGFTSSDAQGFAEIGTSRHPIVGLLRSSQGSSLTIKDIDFMFGVLKASDDVSFVRLRDLGRGLNATIDPRVPWESGYQLARFVRERLGLAPSAFLDIENLVQELRVDIQDVAFEDASILGCCVGSPMYAPLVALNRRCADAIGMSGRRMTLAHELCHLLFDLGGLRSLARFEGGGADSDRMIEMRGNAFAIELLVPMSTLMDAQGRVLDEDQLADVASKQKLSTYAVFQHAKNLQKRLSGW